MEQDTRGMAQVVKKQTLTSVVLDTRVVTERFEKLLEISDELYFKFNKKRIERKVLSPTPVQEDPLSIIQVLSYYNQNLIQLSDLIAEGIVNVSESIE